MVEASMEYSQVVLLFAVRTLLAETEVTWKFPKVLKYGDLQ